MTETTSLFPRPPQAKTMADFVVTIFVLIISTTIMLAVIGTGIVFLLRPETDLSNIVSILSDLINTIIGALVGFLAGQAHGKNIAGEESLE